MFVSTDHRGMTPQSILARKSRGKASPCSACLRALVRARTNWPTANRCAKDYIPTTESCYTPQRSQCPCLPVVHSKTRMTNRPNKLKPYGVAQPHKMLYLKDKPCQPHHKAVARQLGVQAPRPAPAPGWQRARSLTRAHARWRYAFKHHLNHGHLHGRAASSSRRDGQVGRGRGPRGVVHRSSRFLPGRRRSWIVPAAPLT